MIRNGVIDAQKEFAERRYLAGTDRAFDQIKAEAMAKHGVNIECCRETYAKWQRKLFAIVGDLMIDTRFPSPPRIVQWEQVKREG
jgi:hypothetical protein